MFMPTSAIVKLNKELKTFVAQIVEEIVTDPDFGLELSEKAKKRLRQATTYKGKTFLLSDIKEKHY